MLYFLSWKAIKIDEKRFKIVLAVLFQSVKSLDTHHQYLFIKKTSRAFSAPPIAGECEMKQILRSVGALSNIFLIITFTFNLLGLQIELFRTNYKICETNKTLPEVKH